MVMIIKTINKYIITDYDYEHECSALSLTGLVTSRQAVSGAKVLCTVQVLCAVGEKTL